MNSVFDQIKESNYLVTEAEIERLAALHTDVSNTQNAADGSYLKILLAGTQVAMGKGKKKLPNLKEVSTAALDKTHAGYYDAVLRGVTTDDIVIIEGGDEEENKRRRVEQLRRATFARSAKSTLASFIDAGGDIRTLDVATTSKGGLRKWVNETLGIPTWEQAVEAHRSKIEKVCRKLAMTNPGQAREILESVLSHIQDVLDSITGTDRRGQEKVVVYTADVPAIVEIPENFGEQTEGLGHMESTTQEPVAPSFSPEFHIPEAHEFSEVANV